MLFALSALLASPAHALITVCANGCDEVSAQVAIANAPPGETVELGDGVWPINVTIDKNLTVRGQNPGMAVISVGGALAAFTIDSIVGFELRDVRFDTDTGGIVRATQSATVTLRGIDAVDMSPEGSGSLIAMVAGGSLALSDSNFTGYMHSYGNNGAVLWLGGGGTATVDNVVIQGGSAIDGGAIFANDTTATLTNVDISGASAVIDGGAIYVNYTATVNLDGCTFDQNSSGQYGGHIKSLGLLYADNSDFSNGLTGTGYIGGGGAVSGGLQLVNSTFVNNQAIGGGGAVLGFDMQIAGCTFDGNTASQDGGAVRSEGAWPGATSISDSLFVNNTSGAGAGGAVYIGWSQPSTIRNSQFIGNSSLYGPGGAVSMQGVAPQLVDNCYFSGNQAPGLHAGALEIGYNSSLSIIRDCTFEDNGSASAGAVTVIGSLVEIEGSSFCNNQASSEGGAIAARADGPYAQGLTVTNSAFVQNTSMGGAGGIHTREGFGPTALLNNDFLGNIGGLYWGSAVTLYMNDAVDVRNNLFGWNTGAQSPLWAQETVGSVLADYNLYWQNDGTLGASYDLISGGNDLMSDPMLADYTLGMPCGTWDLSPLPGSPAIDGGDPTLLDQDGGRSDVGVSGGPGGDTDPGWNGTGSGTGTGTGAATGTGTGAATGTGTGSSTVDLDADGDGYSASVDCDDGDPLVNPGEKEIANDGIDNNCDGNKGTAWLGGRSCDHGGGGPGWFALALAALGLRRRR